MQHSYQPIIDQLENIEFEVSGKLLETSRLLLKSASYSYYTGSLDDSLWEKIAATGEAISLRIQRTNCAVQADLIRDSFSSYIDEKMPILHEAQRLLYQHSKPFTPYTNQLTIISTEIDNSAENEDWADQFTKILESIDQVLEDFGARCKESAELLRQVIEEDRARYIEQ